jgi:hypothetical protein
MDRRQFVARTLAGSGMAALAGTSLAAAASDPPTAAAKTPKMPSGVLGRTGEKVSRLGIGCAQLGDYADITAEVVGNILHRALELGVNYIDTAPNYQTSEEKLGPTIKEIRDKVFLVTKTEQGSYEGTWRSIRQSLKRLQTDRLDLVHVHSLGTEEWWGDFDFVFGKKGPVEALREARKQGVVRYVGASGHHYPSRFHAALDTGEIDVLMNTANFVARHTYNFEDKLWSRARLKNVGLVAMKVLGGEAKPKRSFRLPEEYYERAIRYALSLPGLSSAVIGIQSVAELERAARTVSEAQPLTADESFELGCQGLDLARQPAWRKAYGEPLT